MIRRHFCILMIALLAVLPAWARAADFPLRGFHLDLRIQVMKPAALRAFAADLAGFGINTLVMEYEASYPYQHQATISNQYAYSREEISSFVSYCDSLGIDVIPLQQCFGHVEYILRHPRYRSLAEDPKDLSQICPLHSREDSLLFADLFADMASLHPSKYIHIGGDETRLLGHCELCSRKAATEGKSKLFVDYMKMICNIVTAMGKTPVMWADILLKHPEAAEELPKQTIFIDWNYGWKTNHFGDIGALQDKGFQFWGAPALRSHPDNWYVTTWSKHFENLQDFIPYSRKANYTGMIMTSWSTSGVYDYTWEVGNNLVDLQQLRNTYPLNAFRILIAAYAQSLDQTDPLDAEKFVQRYAQTRFGLSAAQGQNLWNALNSKQDLIVAGKAVGGQSIAEMLEQAKATVAKLKGMQPSKNVSEYEQYKLMADLRVYYLNFQQLDSIFNSNDFSIGDKPVLLKKAKNLLLQHTALDTRFTALMKDFLYAEEIAEQNRIRNEPLELLVARLSAKR